MDQIRGAPGRGAARTGTVLVMAKAPEPGSAKTRLEPLLGVAGCAQLQAELIRHTAAVAERAVPGAVFVAVAGEQALVRPLVGPAEILRQCDGDLGERLAAAVAQVHARQPGPVVVVGADCPALGPGHLVDALDRLAVGHDVVFGPAHDGGYYLVALARPAPAVFDIPRAAWGGPEVLALSLAAADRAGLATGFVDVEHDLDTPDDAVVAVADARVPAGIVALLSPVLAQ